MSLQESVEAKRIVASASCRVVYWKFAHRGPGPSASIPTSFIGTNSIGAGHFAAFEQPALFTQELRACFGDFRQSTIRGPYRHASPISRLMAPGEVATLSSRLHRSSAEAT